ncbi:amino acid/polyamine transporter I [Amylocarpus encephaloides]|uniref:Amino acid/polyamine transporter I n=1 Tax=Amylocarpus encephaloides TaxID=45428 RepID=A0A9P7Y8X5_9HELO|nr:amino acid/polyamine transporter I [Amylocarpus encephaloides]
MADLKTSDLMTVNDIDEAKGSNSSIEALGSKQAAGKQEHVSVLERYINPTAIINFGFTLQAAWEASGSSIQFSLLNGGPASLVYGSIIAGIGSTSIAISLAEMASLDPVVGAQYRWSAAFAPSNAAFWGLFQGWITVWAWITATAASPAYLSNIVTGLAIFNYPEYEPQRWHGTLIMWGFVIIPVVWNFWFRRMLNTLEMIGGICHVIFFIVSVTTLAVLAERSSASFVFNTIWDEFSGWDNKGVAFSLGMVTVTFPITAFDGVLHMSDEVKGARTQVPHSMILAVVLNGIMQTSFMITLMFCIGDVDRVVNTPTLLPIIEIYYQATQSKAATNLLVAMIAMILFISLFNIFASVSRLAWAFARDNGLPFSKTFSYVHPTLKIPINSLLLVGGICCLLSLINIGSSTAFNALISLPTIALYLSYFIPILFLAIRKLQNRHPKYGPFKLGRYGLPINMFAMCYIIYIVTFLPFPSIKQVTAINMNYAGPLMGAIIIIAIGDWFISGKKRFSIPALRSTMSDE